jgi:hypothetical protein
MTEQLLAFQVGLRRMELVCHVCIGSSNLRRRILTLCKGRWCMTLQGNMVRTLTYSAVAFYARMHSRRSRMIQDDSMVHIVLLMDGGCFCLPSKVVPPCGKSRDVLGRQF